MADPASSGDWTLYLEGALRDPDVAWKTGVELPAVARPKSMEAAVSFAFPLPAPASVVLDPVLRFDRAFRWAVRCVEERRPPRYIWRNSRPVRTGDGLRVVEIRPASATVFFEPSERIQRALLANPASFAFALSQVLQMLRGAVRVLRKIERPPVIQVYVGERAQVGDVHVQIAYDESHIEVRGRIDRSPDAEGL